jgi:hypothetical protein
MYHEHELQMHTSLANSRFAAFVVFVATGAWLASATDVSAATSIRNTVTSPAGACQPFFSTTQARYSATGIRNAGNATFYVVCSMNGTWNENSANGGAVTISVVVRNGAAGSQGVNCTARPGYHYGGISLQAAYPRAATLAPGTSHEFEWTSAEAGVMFRNPNFTCTLPPGMEITAVRSDYTVDIGN